MLTILRGFPEATMTATAAAILVANDARAPREPVAPTPMAAPALADKKES